jgi:hypothetical protein
MKKFDKIFKKNLETILLEAALINDEIFQHVQRVQEDTGRLPGDILVEEKYCTEIDIARELARHLQLPYLEIDKYAVAKGLFDGYPPELLHRLQVVPVDRFGSTVAFAMSQHMSPDGFKTLQGTVDGGEISFYVALMSKVRDLLDKMIPVDKTKLWESQRRKVEDQKPKPASWTDIFDTANKNIVQGMKRDTKITARLDIFDSLKKGDTLVGVPGAPGAPKPPGAPPGGTPAAPAPGAPKAPAPPAPPKPATGSTQKVPAPTPPKGSPPARPAQDEKPKPPEKK